MQIRNLKRSSSLKTIEFSLVNELLEPVDKPAPAIKNLPDWYKDMSPYMFGDKGLIIQNKQTNLTVKKCVPFLDALGAGYYIPSPADVLVRRMPDGPRINWLSSFDVISDHSKEQMKGIDIPENYDSQPFKWMNPWIIKTPKGYSSLFIHPTNRTDLPFHSFSGVVDTDVFPLPVNFPFLLKSNFSGTIKAGTPMIQVIPFKRDSWKTEYSTAKDLVEYEKNLFDFSRSVKHYYRNKWWSRKHFN